MLVHGEYATGMVFHQIRTLVPGHSTIPQMLRIRIGAKQVVLLLPAILMNVTATHDVSCWSLYRDLIVFNRA